MIVLSKEQIEEMVDPDQMMDQIEEAYRIYGSHRDKDSVDLPGEF